MILKSFVIFFDNSSISLLIVAEKKSDCFEVGNFLRIIFISGKNHISSILSASSSTKYFTVSRFMSFCSSKSSNLQGVATIKSRFFSI